MPIHSASNRRQWMDETVHQYAYRCLPLQIANSNGWRLDCPTDILVNWNGSNHKDGISVHYSEPTWDFAASSFGHGIVTFHTGFLFKTESEENYDMLVSGLPNYWYDFMVPLSGIVETWWLNSTFTMNWKIIRPGTFTIRKGEPLVFVTPVPHALPDIEASIVPIEDNPDVLQEYVTWRDRRNGTIEALAYLEQTGKGIRGIDPTNPATQWEKTYTRGIDGSGNRVKGHHTKRKFPDFKTNNK